LWTTIVRQELPAHPLREFLKLYDVITDTQLYWSGGMPDDFIGIAGDFCGNLFGFRRVPLDTSRPDDLPVILFDHDYLCVDHVAASFDAWLNWFVDHVQMTK